MEICKILVRRAVISHRLTLEFIFTCQNANVNVQKEPLSIGVKEAKPLVCVCFVCFFVFVFFCPILLVFYFLLGDA